MTVLRKVWGWIVAGVIGLGAVLGAVFFFRRNRTALAQAEDKSVVAEALKDIERVRGQREEVERRVGDQTDHLAEIDRELAEKRRRVVAHVHHDAETLTDEEVEERFRALFR